MNKVKKGFIAEGTTCASCEKIIIKQVMKVEGVDSVDFDLRTETGYVTYDSQKTNIDEILDSIEEKNYACYVLDEIANSSNMSKSNNKLWGWLAAIFGFALIFYFFSGVIEGINLPAISANMSYGLLFVVGLITGLHCVGMCGGFVVGYTAKAAQNGHSTHKSHLMYGTGKLVSYTVIGAIFGLIGSIIAFTPGIRAAAGIIAGLFLIIYGLNMLNIFPALRRLQIKMPLGLFRFTGKQSKKTNSPLVIGLLNGLMIACGPLQAIYIMAAGTGSLVEGAKLLFIFGLGTLPVMLGFGYIASVLSKKATVKILKASGIVVILLGLVMVNRGLALSGSGYDTTSIIAGITANSNSGNSITGSAIEFVDGYQIINMEVTRSGWSPDTFVLQKDIPVKWNIDGVELTGCNRAIQVPKYGLEFDLVQGMQTIEFTPTDAGVVSWSCWMGMIPGTFIVKEDLENADAVQIQKELAAIPKTAGGSCGAGGSGGSGGGCGCGA